MLPEGRLWNALILSSVDASLQTPKDSKNRKSRQVAYEIEKFNEDIIHSRRFLLNCNQLWETWVGTDYEKFKEVITEMWLRVDQDPRKSLDYRKRLNPLKGTGKGR